jgi:hypothetical protein
MMNNLIIENRFVFIGHYCHHILMKELSLGFYYYYYFMFSLTCINFLKYQFLESFRLLKSISPKISKYMPFHNGHLIFHVMMEVC